MRKLATLLCVLGILACGGDKSSTAPETVTFAGDYTMRTINSQSLPYVLVQSGATALTILDASMSVTQGGVWTQLMHVRATNASTTTTTIIDAGGTWVRSGNQIGFINGSDNTTYYTGTISSNRLDLSDGQLSVVFTK